MKSLITYLSLLLQLHLFAQLPQENDHPGIQIISGEMIKSSGITSIAEILSLSNNWNIASIDGNSNFFTANNLSIYQRQNIIIMLDGQKFDLGIFDVQNLNMLPVSLDQVDYAELIETPGIYMGQFIQSGLIHIHTKKSGRGLSLQGTHTIGDETGDPGALVFTEFESPNVDKLAQYFSVSINTAGDNWFMKSSLKHEETFESDPAIDNRISYLNEDDNKSKLIAYYLNLGVNKFGGLQEVTAAISSNNDYFFFKPYANEIPVKQQIRHFGFKGNSVFKNIGINYSAKLSLSDLGYLKNKQQINFDFGLQNTGLMLEGYFAADIVKILIGVSNENYSANTSQVLTDKNLSLKNLYAQLVFQPGKNFYQTLAVYNTRNYEENSLKGSLTSTWFMNSKNIINTNFSFIQTLFAEDNNFWVWQSRGYEFLPLNSNYITPRTFSPKNLYTADIIYKHIFDSSSFSLAGGFRRFADYYLEKQFFQFNSQNSTFNSLVEVVPHEELNVFIATVGLDYKLSSTTTAKINYIYQYQLSGSSLFKEVWETFPEHKLIVSLFYQPLRTLGLSARLKYVTSTNWHDYKYVSFQSSKSFSTRIEPALLMDLSSNIWLWNKKIWLSASLKNLFNQPEKYHPAGADLDMRMYLQVHFYFNSLVE